MWWDNRLPLFDVYVSPVVLEEARQGASEPAQRRLEVLATFPVLEETPAIESLAATYMTHLELPGKALRDAAHLAFACAYELDYLLTWNCAHIANAEDERRRGRLSSKERAASRRLRSSIAPRSACALPAR
jgi:predicted nucleic acid-binding protein